MNDRLRFDQYRLLVGGAGIVYDGELRLGRQVFRLIREYYPARELDYRIISEVVAH